jgi:SAM-dependent methyltransferase
MSDATKTQRWARDRVFGAAWAYDLAFAWDVSRELDIALKAAGISEPPARLLLPACGTGRYALPLAERGYDVEAFDINPAMLDYAREHYRHPSISYFVADMTQSVGDNAPDCDAAFTFTNSFRYILEATDVDGHLAATYARLKPGGVYVIDLAVGYDPSHVGQKIRWIAKHEDCDVFATWELTALTPPTSMEVATLRVVRKDGAVHEFTDEQPQRVWTYAELEQSAARAGFSIAGVVDTKGRPLSDLAHPARAYVALKR